MARGVGEMLRHNLLEYSELLLFLLAAMTFVNTFEERNVFAALRTWFVRARLVVYARSSGPPERWRFCCPRCSTI